MSYEVKKNSCIGAGYIGGPKVFVNVNTFKYLKDKVLDLNKHNIDSSNKEELIKLYLHEPFLKNLNNSDDNSFKVEDLICIATTNEQVANGAGAILNLTDLDEFKKIEWSKISKLILKLSWIFNWRNIIDLINFKEIALNIRKLGFRPDIDNLI